MFGVMMVIIIVIKVMIINKRSKLFETISVETDSVHARGLHSKSMRGGAHAKDGRTWLCIGVHKM